MTGATLPKSVWNAPALQTVSALTASLPAEVLRVPRRLRTRLQHAAPELLDLSAESVATKHSYSNPESGEVSNLT
jgi:hypothetical protein